MLTQINSAFESEQCSRTYDGNVPVVILFFITVNQSFPFSMFLLVRRTKLCLLDI